MDNLNKRFKKESLKSQDFHVTVGNDIDFRTIFCYEYKKVVSNDWVVRHNNRHFQILKDNKILPSSKSKVLLTAWLDGTIHIIHKKEELNIKKLKLDNYLEERKVC